MCVEYWVFELNLEGNETFFLEIVGSSFCPLIVNKKVEIVGSYTKLFFVRR